LSGRVWSLSVLIAVAQRMIGKLPDKAGHGRICSEIELSSARGRRLGDKQQQRDQKLFATEDTETPRTALA
jgi:hypothetical protein